MPLPGTGTAFMLLNFPSSGYEYVKQQSGNRAGGARGGGLMYALQEPMSPQSTSVLNVNARRDTNRRPQTR